MEFKGYCDTEVVLTWVQEWLIPALNPGDSVIWDNATFQRSPRIAEALNTAGIQLLFLRPYFPNLNPVAKRTEGHLNTSGLGRKPGYDNSTNPHFISPRRSAKCLENYLLNYIRMPSQ